MAIKTKAELSSELASVLTDGGLLTALEDRSLRQNIFDSLAALKGNNAFVGDQAITGAMTLSGGLTMSDLTDSKIVLTNGSKRQVSSAYSEADLDSIFSAWTNQAFNAGDYTGGSGTWTVGAGDVVTNRYKVIGKTMFWNLEVEQTTIAGTTALLEIKIPGGKIIASDFYSIQGAYENGVGFEPLIFNPTALSTTMSINMVNASNFTTGTNNQLISFNIVLEVQ